MGDALAKMDYNGLKTEYRIVLGEFTKNEIAKAKEEAFEKLLTMSFISAVDKKRFQQVPKNLEKKVLKGLEQYLDDLSSLYNILTNWK